MKLSSAVILVLPVALLAFTACGRRSGLYAERTVAVAAPEAEAGQSPRYVGLWAASAEQCRDPMVLEPRRLKALGSDCQFDKVEADSAGYTVVAVCRSSAGMHPTRLTIITPNQARISLLTISGGPFKDSIPLQRCAAQ